jgi:hypothetical protein
MLMSGEATARAALARTALGVAAAPIDRAFQRAERRRIREAQPSERPLLLIVGAPRSGTTLVAQTVVHHLPVSFPNNVSALFPRSPITAQLRFAPRRNGRVPRHNSDDRSYYGQTRRFRDHNDAFHLWDRWLGGERYAVPDTISERVVAEMRAFFDAWRSAFDEPFVNKNNRNTDCMAALAAALPEARFLVVRRDRDETARSLLTARRLVHGDVRCAWGLRSRDASDVGDAERAVAEQLDEIERRLEHSLLAIAPERVSKIEFASFCANPVAGVHAAAELLDLARPETTIPPILRPNPRRDSP